MPKYKLVTADSLKSQYTYAKSPKVTGYLSMKKDLTSATRTGYSPVREAGSFTPILNLPPLTKIVVSGWDEDLNTGSVMYIFCV